MSPDIELPVTIEGNLDEFIARSKAHIIRTGKDMVGYFVEDPEPDALIYEVHELDSAGNMKLAITILKAGVVGDEYHMTKGHYHEDALAPETYHCLKGNGMMVLQTEDGMTKEVEMLPGSIIYIPHGWAHRTVNVGDEDLIL